MRGTLTKLKKLRGRSLDELRVRGMQALSVLAERRGWSQQTRIPSDADFFRMFAAGQVMTGGGLRAPLSDERLLRHFRTRSCPRFFASFDGHEQAVEFLRCRFGPETERATIERARRICQGRFDLLGLCDLDFGETVDWHLEPTSGKRAPLAHWSRINYLDAQVAGDKKVTWELNRHQYFATLGRAYWYTNDEGFAETFAAHLGAWMDANPPKLGINWASSLEVSFRLISWLWALYFFKDSPSLTPELFLRALKHIYLHARHLETYLSTYFSPNTHLTGEALGLFYAGTLLPELDCAARWRATGHSVLVNQLARHVRPDGVYFEQSSYYHRYTTDFYTHLVILARLNGEAREPVIEPKLTALLDHLMHITRPDGTTPLFGDDDGGRLMMLEEGRAPDDFRAALSTGAALFARRDYKYVAGELSEETFWLTGHEGARAFDALEAEAPAGTSRAFPDGGYYVMRDGWTRAANYMLVDCGPHGSDNCGHAHADALAFDMAARGRTLLVNPGTYTYTGSAGMRDLFRSSPAHNTLTLDGESSSVTGSAFQWRHIAASRARTWTTTARFDLFEGEHDGYMRLRPAPARHVRSVLFLKGDYWLLRDRVETEGEHQYELHFHFDPASDLLIEEEKRALVRERADGRVLFEVVAPQADGDIWQAGEGYVSRCYAQKETAPVLTCTRRARGTQEFYTFLVPCGAAATETRLSEPEATGGRAFELRRVNLSDLLLVAAPGAAVETAGVLSDFTWTWARFADGRELPAELLLIGGRRFVLGGVEIVRAEGGRIGYLHARLAGDDLQVETDAGAHLSFAYQGARRLVVNGRAHALEGGRLACVAEGGSVGQEREAAMASSAV